MNVDETKAALLTAQRAYTRALRATACGLATNNLRLGQKWEQRGRTGLRALLGKTEWRLMSPVQRDLFTLDLTLPAAAGYAHLHRLQLCGISELQYEHAAAADRARSANAVDRARERHARKRPKRRR